MRVRSDFRISMNGRHAVCLVATAETGLRLETWIRSPAGGWRPRRRLGGVRHPQMLPGDDGSVFVHDTTDDGPAIWRIDPDGVRRRLTPPEWSADVRLFAPPRPGRPGLAIVYRGAASEIRRLADDAPGLTDRLAYVPGVLMSGLRLDPAGHLLAIERSRVPGGPTDVVTVDLTDGSWDTLLDTGPHSYDTVLLTHPETGLVLIGTDVAGGRRIGVCRLGAAGGHPVRFPAALNPPGEPVEPLAAAPDGAHVLLARTVGTRCQLSLYTPATEDVRPVDLPPGQVIGPVRWTDDALSFPFSTPVLPPRLVSMKPAPGAAALVTAPPIRTPASGRVRVRTVSLPGATGAVEAIVYGGQSWWTTPHLVVALHGGPLSAWRYEFHPLLHRLARAGASVVALNQRGSTGYGAAHARAIEGAWGGPDLDDVLSVSTAIAHRRAGPGLGGLRLLGDSYGAYLALLAAGVAPSRWSHCAALAPFLSGRRLYAEAGPGVRGLVDRLGGRTDIDDRRGPRDLLTFCHRIEADVLLAHGTRDVMVPVSQSRTLYRRLTAIDGRTDRSVRYLEVPDGSHELTTDPTGPVADAVVAFLTSAQDLRRRRSAAPGRGSGLPGPDSDGTMEGGDRHGQEARDPAADRGRDGAAAAADRQPGR